MPYIYREVEIDISDFLYDIDTDDLIAELKRRHSMTEVVTGEYSQELLNIIYQKRRCHQDYQNELSELIDRELGRI